MGKQEVMDRAAESRSIEAKAKHDAEHGDTGGASAQDERGARPDMTTDLAHGPEGKAAPADTIFMIERGAAASTYVLRHSYRSTVAGREEKFPEIIVRFNQFDKQVRDKHGEISHKGWLKTDLRDCVVINSPNPLHRPTGTAADKTDQLAALAAMLMETREYRAGKIMHFEEFDEIRAHDRRKAQALAALDAEFDGKRKGKVGKRGAAPSMARP